MSEWGGGGVRLPPRHLTVRVRGGGPAANIWLGTLSLMQRQKAEAMASYRGAFDLARQMPGPRDRGGPWGRWEGRNLLVGPYFASCSLFLQNAYVCCVPVQRTMILGLDESVCARHVRQSVDLRGFATPHLTHHSRAPPPASPRFRGPSRETASCRFICSPQWGTFVAPRRPFKQVLRWVRSHCVGPCFFCGPFCVACRFCVMCAVFCVLLCCAVFPDLVPRPKVFLNMGGGASRVGGRLAARRRTTRPRRSPTGWPYARRRSCT